MIKFAKAGPAGSLEGSEEDSSVVNPSPVQ
jgi:hypothetical protein